MILDYGEKGEVVIRVSKREARQIAFSLADYHDYLIRCEKSETQDSRKTIMDLIALRLNNMATKVLEFVGDVDLEEFEG